MFHNSILGSKLCLGVKPAKDPGADGTEFRAPCDSVGSPTWGIEGGWYGSGLVLVKIKQ